MNVVGGRSRNVAIDGFSGTDIRVMGVLNKCDKTNIAPLSELPHDRAVWKFLWDIAALFLKLDQVIISNRFGWLVSSSAKVVFGAAFGLLRGVRTSAGDAAVIVRWRVAHSLKRQRTRWSKGPALRLCDRAACFGFPVTAGRNRKSNSKHY